jgi:phosphoglycolate phosphatase
MAICSNKPEELCRKILLDLNLDGHFIKIVGGDSKHSPKPDPMPLLWALGECAPRDAIFVGDSLIDQRTSEASGVPFVFFTGGYNDGVDFEKCFKVIDQMEELQRIVAH